MAIHQASSKHFIYHKRLRALAQNINKSCLCARGLVRVCGLILWVALSELDIRKIHSLPSAQRIIYTKNSILLGALG